MKKIEMLLDRDEFLVSYDARAVTVKRLLATVKKSGFTARVVAESVPTIAPVIAILPAGFPWLDEALAKAKAENKPIVIDLHAAWCAPCRQLERLTFPHAQVKALLAQTLFLRIDTDEQPDLAKRLGVAGLPDIRFALPDGTIVRQLRSFQTAATFAEALRQLLQKVTPR